MKSRLPLALLAISLFFSMNAFSYHTYKDDYSTPSCGDDNSCQCTDPGCGKSQCTTYDKCCRAFGNVGAL